MNRVIISHYPDHVYEVAPPPPDAGNTIDPPLNASVALLPVSVHPVVWNVLLPVRFPLIVTVPEPDRLIAPEAVEVPPIVIAPPAPDLVNVVQSRPPAPIVIVPKPPVTAVKSVV